MVHVLDLILLTKELDGSVDGFESHDFGDVDLGGLRELETELALLLGGGGRRRDRDGFGAGERRGFAGRTWAAPFDSGRSAVGRTACGQRPDPDPAPAAVIEADDAMTREGV
jgi:hypothetical protein